MALIPFRKEGQFALSDLQDEINNLFGRVWHGGFSTGPFDGQEWAPAVDVLEENDRYVVRAEVPGLEAADISLTFADGALVIKGQKGCDYEDESRKGLIHRERRFGAFVRNVPLPAVVESSKISASCRNGVLEVTLAKKEESKAKVIKIDVQE